MEGVVMNLYFHMLLLETKCVGPLYLKNASSYFRYVYFGIEEVDD